MDENFHLDCVERREIWATFTSKGLLAQVQTGIDRSCKILFGHKATRDHLKDQYLFHIVGTIKVTLLESSL